MTVRNFVSILLFSLLACKTSPQTSTIDKIEKIAIERLGESIEKQPNSSSTYLLFSQKPNPQTPTRVIKAIVIEVTTGKIVAEENFVPGYIKWITKTSLEVLSIPGMIRANQSLSDFTKTIQLAQPQP